MFYCSYEGNQKSFFDKSALREYVEFSVAHVIRIDTNRLKIEWKKRQLVLP